MRSRVQLAALCLVTALIAATLSSCWYTEEPVQNEQGQTCREDTKGFLLFRYSTTDCSPNATNIGGNELHPPVSLHQEAPPPAAAPSPPATPAQ